MAVDIYSLITLEDLKDWAAIENVDLEVGALTIYGSDGTAATAKVAGNVLTLVKAGGANPGTFTFNLAAAAYDTLTELVAAICATAGWVANRLANGAIASTELKNVAATSCLGTGEELTLKGYDNRMLEKEIDRASGLMEDALRRKIKSRDYLNERYDGDGDEELLLRNYPVTKVERVAVGTIGVIGVKYDSDAPYNCFIRVTSIAVELWRDGAKDGDLALATYATFTALLAAINALSGWSATLYITSQGAWPTSLLIELQNKYCRAEYADLLIPEEPMSDIDIEDAEAGIIRSPSGFGYGYGNVYVTYTGGYGTVPNPLVEGCCRLAGAIERKRREDPNMKSESMPDYSYTAAEMEDVFGKELWSAIKKYKRPLAFRV